MTVIRSIFLFAAILILGCKNKSSFDNKSSEISKANNSTVKPIHDSVTNSVSSKAYFKVSAHLIYNDGTISDFDVLNNKRIVLWNVVIGEGDASKPSSSTKIRLEGNLDSLYIKIRNGHELVIDTKVIHFKKSIEYIVMETGCSIINVNVTRNIKLVYNDSIPFHCGE